MALDFSEKEALAADAYLEPWLGVIRERAERAASLREQVTRRGSVALGEFASAYEHFGFVRDEDVRSMRWCGRARRALRPR